MDKFGINGKLRLWGFRINTKGMYISDQTSHIWQEWRFRRETKVNVRDMSHRPMRVCFGEY